MRKYKIIVAIVILFTFQKIQAQIGAIEIYSGFNKTGFNGNLIAPLDEKGKFSFVGLAFFHQYHHQKDKGYNETGIQAGAFYSIQNFKVGLGLHSNSILGLQQRAVLIYAKPFGSFFIVVAPALSFNEGLVSGEVAVDVVFEKLITEDWGLFVKMLGMMAYDNFDTHGRSFLQPRLGTAYKKMQFGLAVDFDQWGPYFESRLNYGLFVRKKL